MKCFPGFSVVLRDDQKLHAIFPAPTRQHPTMTTFHFDPFPQLTTGRLLLRRPQPADAETFAVLRSNPHVGRYLDRPPQTSLAEAEAFIAGVNQATASGTALYWVIALRATGAMVGTICLWNFSRDNTRVELGYELHPDHQGLGIMAEAVAAVLEYGFHQMNLDAIEAFPKSANERSVRLLEKFGFALENAPNGEDLGVYALYVLPREQ